MKSVPGGFHLLAAHGGYIESSPRRFHGFARFQLVGGKLPSLLLKKIRPFPIADTVYIMSGVPAVPMKHHNIGNGKAMSLEVGGVVDIKAGVNIFKGSVRRKGRGIDQILLCPVYSVSRCLQTVVRLKAQVPCFVSAL